MRKSAESVPGSRSRHGGRARRRARRRRPGFGRVRCRRGGRRPAGRAGPRRATTGPSPPWWPGTSGSSIRVLARLVRDEELARDLAQETFWKVYNRLDRFDTSRRFGPWLFRVGVNLGLDLLRRHDAPAASLSIDRPADDGPAGVRPARPRPAAPRRAGAGGPVHPGAGPRAVPDDPGPEGPGRVFVGGGGGDRGPPRGHGAVATGQGARAVPRTLGTPAGGEVT